MFHGWDEYYLIVGSTAGALIGLIFVVVTLAAGLDATKRVSQGTQVYMSPIVFHFAAIVLVSAISAVPEMPPMPTGVILLACAVVGFVYSAVTTVRMFAPGWEHPPDWSDRYFYGFLPALCYAGFAAAAGAVWIAPRGAALGVGAVMLVLLLIGIRNAWDLASFISARSRGPTT